MTASEYTTAAPLWADDAMRFAVRIGGLHEDQEDAVQEGLAALWKKHAEVEANNGKCYLLGATYKHLMQTFRHRRVEQEYFNTIEQEPTQAPTNTFDLREAIERSLQTLSPQQKAILQLRDVEGYTYKEIATTLELTEEKVQVYLFRARVKMRKQLTQQGYGND